MTDNPYPTLPIGPSFEQNLERYRALRSKVPMDWTNQGRIFMYGVRLGTDAVGFAASAALRELVLDHWQDCINDGWELPYLILADMDLLVQRLTTVSDAMLMDVAPWQPRAVKPVTAATCIQGRLWTHDKLIIELIGSERPLARPWLRVIERLLTRLVHVWNSVSCYHISASHINLGEALYLDFIPLHLEKVLADQGLRARSGSDTWSIWDVDDPTPWLGFELPQEVFRCMPS